MIPIRWWRREEDREDIDSEETWNGGDGTISLNRLQQHEVGFDPAAVPTPVEEIGTTDPWGIADQ